MSDINSLVSGVINRIGADQIPETITGSPMIYEWLDDARIEVNTITCYNYTASNIPESYGPVLKNLAAAYTLSNMMGIGVDYDYKIGNFSVKKGSSGDPNSKQISFFLDRANLGIVSLGTCVPYNASFTG